MHHCPAVGFGVIVRLAGQRLDRPASLQQSTVDRELRMLELKRQIDGLHTRLGGATE
ncbi:MAG: hypothetical protein ABI565_10610 [Vicinamibacteria bacterium]